MDIRTVKAELKHLPNLDNGGTWSNLWRLLYYTRLFKYVHREQFKYLNKTMFKVCATKKLNELCERGYLFSPGNDVYCATKMVDPILREANLPEFVFIFPSIPDGEGYINEINNTEVFIKLAKQPDFYTLLYPNFGYLRPDALLVEKRDSKYRLTCLEIEAKKPNWKEYIDEKIEKYKKLSTDIQFYDWWCVQCEKLGFRKPLKEDFKFNYKIIKYE